MHEAIVSLCQQAINLLETSSRWDDRAACDAHSIGLQGEKRRMRYISRKAHMSVQKLQHACIDLFNTKLYPQVAATEYNTILDRQTYMATVLQRLWKVYFDYHKLANEMVAGLYRSFADELYDHAACILKILQELHRANKEYEWAKWEYHHISRYQVEWHNVHDKYEEKEEKQDYKA